MNMQQVAEQLVTYCRQGDWYGAYNNLYSPKIVSIEPYSTPFFEKESIGLDAVRAKAAVFENMIEQLYSIEVSEPLTAGNRIAFTITIDAVRKNAGRLISPEICVYTLANDKNVKEEFFYD